MSDYLLIFDCDGVLVDSEPLSLGLLIDHCAQHGLTLDMPQACDAFLGKPVADSANEARRMFDVNVPDVDLAMFQHEILTKFKEELKPTSGIADALKKLQMPMCVASSSNPERIQASLSLTGLSDFFDGKLFSTDTVERGKPHPDVFLHAAKEMGFAPSNSIVIEDSPAGLQAAQAANMKTIAYTGGLHAPHANLAAKLEAFSPDIIINDMAQLGDAISRCCQTNSN